MLGRDLEIRQMIDILTRRRQNNPILTGEAGVGKTAVVEGFALRVAQGDVPPPLRNVTVRTLDLALLQAGAGVKGEFENRLKGLIEEVKSSPTPIILFIDEAHTMIGAGGQAGQDDAANLLKPALARGELRTIAATTWSEYKKYFEKDAALARRFQVVKVEEPTEAQCMVMLRGIVGALEKHHNVRILDEAVAAAVRLLASLSGRPAVARQSRQRAGYRLRAPVAGPERHAARDRRRHAPARRPGSAAAHPGARSGRRRRSRRAAGRDRDAEVRSGSPPDRACTSAGTRSATWSRKIRDIRTKLEGEPLRQWPGGRGYGCFRCRRAPTAPQPAATGAATAAAPAVQAEPTPAGAARPTCRAGSRTRCLARRRRPDARLRRCPDRRRSDLRLDRHSRRQDAEG